MELKQFVEWQQTVERVQMEIYVIHKEIAQLVLELVAYQAAEHFQLMGKHISMFTEKLEVKDTTDYASKLKAARERVKNVTNDEK